MRNRTTLHPLSRMGAAPLEFVLCMPVLLVLIVSIVWLGVSVVAQSRVAVEARYLAWQQRFNAEGTPLLFLEDNFVNETSTEEVEVSPLLDDMPPPEATHHVMMGSWDHAALSLDKAPHWKEYLQVAANAKTGNLQTTYTDVRNDFSDWQNASRQAWQTLGQQLLEKITGMGTEAEAEVAKAEEATDGREKTGEIDERIARVEQEVARTEAKLRALKNQKKDGLKDADRRSLEARIAMYDKKLKRLEGDLRDLESDRDEVASASSSS